MKITNTSILKILIDIGETSSRKEKEAILSQHKDNLTLRKVIFAALNPYVNYYIKKIPNYTPAAYESTMVENLDWAIDQLNELSSRRFTGNAAINKLVEILSSLNVEDGQVIERIIEKDLKCGIAASTINKSFGEQFIPTYPVMLCEKFDKRYIKKFDWGKGIRVDLKEDGIRINVRVEGNRVDFCGRSGKTVETHGVLDEQFLTLATIKTIDDSQVERLDVVFDGELLAVDSKGNLLPRKISNGICNKAIKGTITKEEANSLRVSLWDIIPIHDFESGRCDATLASREELLSDLHKRASTVTDMSRVTLTPFKYVDSLQEAQGLFLLYLADGKEGVILKNPQSPWEDKRSQHFIKMKAEDPCDLKVVGVIEGTGKYVGMMGSLQCETECGLIKVNVGSGFKDSDRNLDLYQNLPMIIEVKYNEIIQDKDGNYSLFLPIFKSIRYDKEVANTLKELK